MKNVHLIATDKPSRLLKTMPKGNLILSKSITSGSHWENQHIYITSDEEIKDSWVLNTHSNEVYFLKGYYGIQPITKKIILTTDLDLIKNGVQAINDEFLQWFVKNPSCKEVKIESWQTKGEWDLDYKIIIPKEELKQELEEAAENYTKDGTKHFMEKTNVELGFIAGAKWQSERDKQHQQSVDFSNVNANNITTASTENQTLWKEMYSEEEVKQFAFECVANFLSNDDNKVEIKLVDVIIDRVNNKFEQFKKK